MNDCRVGKSLTHLARLDALRRWKHAESDTPFPLRAGGASTPFVVTVKLTRHLYEFFPSLEGQEIRVEATTVAEVLDAVEKIAPGFSFYVCDERGCLRTHVNVFVEGTMIADRRRLSDRVAPDDQVFILQALSGG